MIVLMMTDEDGGNTAKKVLYKQKSAEINP